MSNTLIQPSQLHSTKFRRDFCYWKDFEELFHSEQVQITPLLPILREHDRQKSVRTRPRLLRDCERAHLRGNNDQEQYGCYVTLSC